MEGNGLLFQTPWSIGREHLKDKGHCSPKSPQDIKGCHDHIRQPPPPVNEPTGLQQMPQAIRSPVSSGLQVHSMFATGGFFSLTSHQSPFFSPVGRSSSCFSPSLLTGKVQSRRKPTVRRASSTSKGTNRFLGLSLFKASCF